MNRLTLEKLLSYINENVLKNTKIDLKLSEENDQYNLCKILEFGNTQCLSFIKDEFSGLLKDHVIYMYRHGVCHTDKLNGADINISLYFSLLLIIKPDYKILPKEQQLQLIAKLSLKIINDLNSFDLFKKYEYNIYGWTKNDLTTDIKKFICGRRVIKFLSDYLHLNIWILNFDTNEIMLSFSNNVINKYRDNIILFLHQYVYEIVYYNDICVLNGDHVLIHHLYKNLNLIQPLPFDFKNTINLCIGDDDLNRLINKKNKTNIILSEKKIINNNIIDKIDEINKIDEIDEIDDIDDIDDNDEKTKSIFIKNNIPSKTKKNIKKNIHLTTKMKLDDLQEIAKKNDIDITCLINNKIRNKTKEQLMIEIRQL